MNKVAYGFILMCLGAEPEPPIALIAGLVVLFVVVIIVIVVVVVVVIWRRRRSRSSRLDTKLLFVVSASFKFFPFNEVCN